MLPAGCVRGRDRRTFQRANTAPTTSGTLIFDTPVLFGEHALAIVDLVRPRLLAVRHE
jgi:hypothetical protein